MKVPNLVGEKLNHTPGRHQCKVLCDYFRRSAAERLSPQTAREKYNKAAHARRDLHIILALSTTIVVQRTERGSREWVYRELLHGGGQQSLATSRRCFGVP